jgi:hypothetical protein
MGRPAGSMTGSALTPEPIMAETISRNGVSHTAVATALVMTSAHNRISDLLRLASVEHDALVARA